MEPCPFCGSFVSKVEYDKVRQRVSQYEEEIAALKRAQRPVVKPKPKPPTPKTDAGKPEA